VNRKRTSLRRTAYLFLYLVLIPVLLMLAYQTIANFHRASRVSELFQRYEISVAAATDYQTFLNGVTDAVDTGKLGEQGFQALEKVKGHAERARKGLGKALAAGLDDSVVRVVDSLRRDRSLESLSAVKPEIRAIDQALEDARQSAEHSATAALRAAAIQGRAEAAIIGTLALVALVLTVFLLRSFVRSFGKPLAYAIHAAKGIADGDLEYNIEPPRSNEIGDLLEALKTMIERLRGMIAEIGHTAGSVADISADILANSTDLSARTEAQASTLEETAASIEELSSAVSQNADNAREATMLAREVAEVAARSGHVVSDLVDKMNVIGGSSKRITDIAGVIDSIAFQTNILALNAAVEAARAGEQGKGFGVVATEVRELSKRCAAASAEIRVLITETTEVIRSGGELAAQAGQSMSITVERIEVVAKVVDQIATANAEQRGGISQVNEAITQMETVTHQNAQVADRAHDIAARLNEYAANLSRLISKFKLGRDAAVPKKPIEPRSPGTPRAPATPRALPAKKTSSARRPMQPPDESWTEF
jgi:methyl-accepting chemotaxis protein